MANEQNLIPFNKRSPREHRELSAKGGKATKGIPRYKLTKCKSCKLPCPLKDEGIEKNWKCKVPDVKRKILEAAVYPEKLKESLYSDVFDLQINAKSFTEKERVFNAKLSLEKEFNSKLTQLNFQQNNITFGYEEMQKIYEKYWGNKNALP